MVFPAAGYISLGLVAATQAAGYPISLSSGPETPTEYNLRHFKIGSALVIEEGAGTEIVIDLRSVDTTRTNFHFTVSSVSSDKWTTHASGSIQVTTIASGESKFPGRSFPFI